MPSCARLASTAPAPSSVVASIAFCFFQLFAQESALSQPQRGPVGQVKEAKKPNILLLSVDTLRSDALHTYGFPLEITPALDDLAARGTLFEDALTTIGKTGPSFSSLFTSLSPPSHGARRNGIPLRPDVPTLAEALSAHGYRTAAFISNWTLRSGLAQVNRGFATYDENFDAKRNVFGANERSAEAVVAAAFEHLDKAGPGGPNFLWVHFSEPHTPYELHPSVSVPEPPLNERTPGWQKRWRYATEVAYTDTQVRELLTGLGKRWNLKESLVIFVGDHGESLGEHGYWGHGKTTNWPDLRIPLILAGPGIPQGRRIAEPVQITDLFPTVMDTLGIDMPKTDIPYEGVSLLAAWGKGLAKDRARFTLGDRHTAFGSRTRMNYEDPKEISLQTSSVKVVFDFNERRTIYYDLSKDPGELRPLDQPPTESTPPWRRRLATWYRSLPKYEGSSGDISDEDRRQLESMGYIGGP